MEHHKDGYESDVAMSEASSTSSDMIDGTSINSSESSNSLTNHPMRNPQASIPLSVIVISSDSEEEEIEQELIDLTDFDSISKPSSPR